MRRRIDLPRFVAHLIFLRADRTFQTNVSDYDSPPHANLHALVKTLNPPIMVENSPDPYGPIPSPDEEINKWYPNSDLYQVVDLMKRCLECVRARSCPLAVAELLSSHRLDCTKRWTAQECLEHPFFRGEYDIGLGRTVFRESAYAAVGDEASA